MEYKLILTFGIIIGISMVVPIAVYMIKQTEEKYEERVRKLEERVYGEQNNI
jgi:hypothetical protein